MRSENVKHAVNIHAAERKHKYSSVTICAAAGCAMLMISPSISVGAAKKGVELWFTTVLPSLLPFFIFTDMLVKNGAYDQAERVLGRPVRFLMGTPGAAAFVFVTSVISGYPAGARVIGEMRRKGEITDVEAADMLSFCSTSGPLFIVGAVGTGMLGSAAAGYILLISHYLSAIITGLFFAENSVLNRLVYGKSIGSYRRAGRIMTESTTDPYRSKDPYRSDKSITTVMAEAISSSFSTLFVIGGFIVIFSILTEYICHYLPIIIENISGIGYEESLGISVDETGGFVTMLVTAAAGMLEMTVGCSRICGLQGISAVLMTVICSFFISFGGLSVAMQTMSMLKGTDIKMMDQMRIKLFQGTVSALITMGLISFVC